MKRKTDKVVCDRQEVRPTKLYGRLDKLKAES